MVLPIKRISSLLVFFVLMALSTKISNAQEYISFSMDSGLKYTEETGIGFDGRFNFAFDRVVLGVSPVDLNFAPQGYKDGYRREGDICRNTENGQFADSENCTVQWKVLAGFSTDAAYRIPGNDADVLVGLGYRLGNAQTIYGKFRVNITPEPAIDSQYWYVNIQGGQQLLLLGGGIAFSL